MKTKAERNLERLNRLLNAAAGFAVAWIIFAIIMLAGAIS